jgi:hypothetical protein
MSQTQRPTPQQPATPASGLRITPGVLDMTSWDFNASKHIRVPALKDVEEMFGKEQKPRNA